MESMPPPPPVIESTPPVRRWRWWVHLVVISSYVLVVAALGVTRNHSNHPALSDSATGLLAVCAVQLLFFGIFLGLAWWASRASADDLLLRWRGKGMPLAFGLAYSVGLRLAVGLVMAGLGVVLVLTGVVTPTALHNFVNKNRPGVENVIDVAALRNNPAYLWLSVTLVSFVVAGLREELWRSSFLAGMRALWPRAFGPVPGQVGAVAIAAVIFGLGHASMGIVACVMAGLLGLGLGLIMVFHRSIWPAVLAHGFFDATSMALIPWALELLKQLPQPSH